MSNKVWLYALALTLLAACTSSPKQQTETNTNPTTQTTPSQTNTTPTDTQADTTKAPQAHTNHNPISQQERQAITQNTNNICTKGRQDSLIIDAFRLVEFTDSSRLFLITATLPQGQNTQFKAHAAANQSLMVGQKWPVFILKNEVASQTGPCE